MIHDEAIDDRRWDGFKIVMDNVDKIFKASFERTTHSNRSLHYYNSYAMLDRIDFSGLSEIEKRSNIDISTLLPNKDDLEMMESNFITLVSR